jgi:glycosyltransferase involved in cell wall biosynthesis
MWLPATVRHRAALFRDTPWSPFAEAFGVTGRLAGRLARGHRDAVQSVDRIFATSEWAKRGLVEEDAVDPERIAVVGTGLHGATSPPPLAGKDYSSGRTLCVARVRQRHKGVDLLLEAFAAARRRLPHLSLDLVVPHGMFAEQAGVRIHSDIPRAALDALFDDAALYAMPARYEPWGLVYLEAQLHGTPVLGSDRCAFPELTDGGVTGFQVSPLTAVAVAEALVAAHADPGLLEQMGRVGQAFARAFTWERTARKILDVGW